MRKFKLINGKGEILSLTNDRIAFDNPSGLGISRHNEVQKTKSGQILMSSDTEFQNISGDLRFLYEPYLSYRKMVEFCQNAPLFLGYAPEDEFFYREVALGELGKSEMDKTLNVMNCRMEIIPLSMWYGDIEFNPELLKKRPAFPFSSKHFVFYENKFDGKEWFPHIGDEFLIENNFSQFSFTFDISNVNEKLKREQNKDNLLMLDFYFSKPATNMQENIVIIPIANNLNVKNFTFLNLGGHHNATVLYEFINNQNESFIKDLRDIYREIYFEDIDELEFQTFFYNPIIGAIRINDFYISDITNQIEALEIKSIKIEGFKSYEAV